MTTAGRAFERSGRDRRHISLPVGPTPLTDRHAEALRLAANGPLPANVRPLPAEICDGIAAELRAALVPAGAEAAARWAEFLIGSYPHARPPEPAIYVRAVTAALAECPEDLGPLVVRGLVGTNRFLPAAAEICAAVADALEVRRALLVRAERHRLAAAQRARDYERDAMIAADRADMAADPERREAWFSLDAIERHAAFPGGWADWKAAWAQGGAEAWATRCRALARGRAREIGQPRAIMVAGYLFRRWWRQFDARRENR